MIVLDRMNHRYGFVRNVFPLISTYLYGVCVIIFVISIGHGVVFSLSFLPPPQFSGNKVVNCTWIYLEDSDCILSR